ncbi:MAG: hypothetical protein JOY83_26905 [Alphaproteobacteria bacterium]|nr:hypothetical protein [Alphaproteobacteria bacterium]
MRCCIAFQRLCARRHDRTDRGDRAPDQKLNGRTEAAKERARSGKAAASAIAKRGAAFERGGSPSTRGGRSGAAGREPRRNCRDTSDTSGLTGASRSGGLTADSPCRGQGHRGWFPWRPTDDRDLGRPYVFCHWHPDAIRHGHLFSKSAPDDAIPEPQQRRKFTSWTIFFVARYDDWTFNITPDFGGSPEGNNTSQFLYEANLNYTGFKPVTATVGYFKPWVTLYDSQSSSDFLLMERPSIIEIGRNVAAGDARATGGLKASTDQYFAAFALTGASYGAQNNSLLNGEQIGMMGRLAGRPYYDTDWNVHLDLSGEYVVHPNINANGTAGVNRTTLNFQDRPEDRAADENRLISTGNLSSSSANVYGGEAAINWRNLLVQGGYYQIGDTQSKLPGVRAPHLSFNGGYVEAGWNITGEPFRYNVGAAAFARPKVDDPFIIKDGSIETGIGAWQLGARWSVMNLNSNVTPGLSQSVTGGVFGGYQQIFGAALSWYPNDWVRLELQFQYTMIDKLNAAGTTQIGQKFETLAGRAQVAF